VLPASLPKYEDLESTLREKAGPAWTVFYVYLSVILISSFLALGIWGADEHEPAFLFLEFVARAQPVSSAMPRTNRGRVNAVDEA
jgi:hypothetical protein